MNPMQLPLNLTLRKDATFKNFYPGDNGTLLTALDAFNNGQGEQFIYLWGPAGVGRTHLLQACCHFQQEIACFYLSLAMPGLSWEILQGLEHLQLVCLDDIEAVLGHPRWEEELLHFYNRAQAASVRMLVVGNHPPTQSNCQLPDLRSRLSWGWVFQVKPLSDQQKIQALQLRAQDRGLDLPDAVGHFLLHHYPRDMSALFELLDQLDQASFVSQHKLTIPFIKSVLNPLRESQ